MRTRTVSLLLTAAALLAPATASAQAPGALDPSFGERGVAVAAVGGGGFAHLVAEAPDGPIFAGGAALDAAGRDALGVARFTASGQPDRGFGDNGSVVVQIGSGQYARSSPAALLPEADGGVVIVGSANRDRDGSPDAAVVAVRLGARGNVLWEAVHHISEGYPDPTGATAAVRRPDGKIVVVARAVRESQLNYEVALLRLNPEDGSLDESFAGDGVAFEQRDHSGGEDAQAGEILLLPSGEIVVAGTVGRPCGHNRCHTPLLQRWTPDGQRDPSFGNGPLGFEWIRELALAPDGSLLASGVGIEGVYYGVNLPPGLLRYTDRGEVDPTFAPPSGIRGIVLPQGIERAPNGLTVQPTGGS